VGGNRIVQSLYGAYYFNGPKPEIPAYHEELFGFLILQSKDEAAAIGWPMIPILV
jgi:hypothetical protein